MILGVELTGSLPVKATKAVPKGLLGSSLIVLHTPNKLNGQSLNTVVYCMLAFSTLLDVVKLKSSFG